MARQRLRRGLQTVRKGVQTTSNDIKALSWQSNCVKLVSKMSAEALASPFRAEFDGNFGRALRVLEWKSAASQGTKLLERQRRTSTMTNVCPVLLQQRDGFQASEFKGTCLRYNFQVRVQVGKKPGSVSLGWALLPRSAYQGFQVVVSIALVVRNLRSSRVLHKVFLPHLDPFSIPLVFLSFPYRELPTESAAWPGQAGSPTLQGRQGHAGRHRKDSCFPQMVPARTLHFGPGRRTYKNMRLAAILSCLLNEARGVD